MGYKLVRLVALSVLTALGLNATYWLVSLAGSQMSLIGLFWWLSLSTLSALGTVMALVGVIITITEL